MFRKLLDEGQAGDNIGALLRGTKKEDVERGQVLCAPGSITPHTNFEGKVYVLTKEEGGRHKPFFNNFLLGTAKKCTNVVACLTFVEQLAEHFNTCAGGLLCVTETNDFDVVTSVNLALLNLAGYNGSTTSDREHVFNWHKEWLVKFTLWLWD